MQERGALAGVDRQVVREVEFVGEQRLGMPGAGGQGGAHGGAGVGRAVRQRLPRQDRARCRDGRGGGLGEVPQEHLALRGDQFAARPQVLQDGRVGAARALHAGGGPQAVRRGVAVGGRDEVPVDEPGRCGRGRVDGTGVAAGEQRERVDRDARGGEDEGVEQAVQAVAADGGVRAVAEDGADESGEGAAGSGLDERAGAREYIASICSANRTGAASWPARVAARSAGSVS
ncbi:hypothetical protein BJF79_23810 [Actinomadura sp. CNU-125]|nr:hypothetical protein BJF79_23810 [Actinomadura sp. CNU-125]